MKIGDEVTVTPETLMGCGKDGKQIKRPMTGKVVYIHPRGWFYTVEFETKGGPVRESFMKT